MTISFSRVLAATWRLFARERLLVIALAAPFVFLPGYALLLLTDPIPAMPDAPRDENAVAAWLAQVTQWAGANGGWYLLADAVELFGLAAIALLLLSGGRATVGEALRGAARRFPVFLGANILAAIPVSLGLWLFVLPGLWVQARLIATLPALAAEPRGGVTGALQCSARLTRGRGLALTGATVALFLLQWFAATPLLTADGWLRIGGHENPVLLALVDAALALLSAGWRTALLLMGVVVYRAFASKGT